MSIFKKKPKTNFLTDVELFEKDYESLSEALLGEFDAGSKDTKETKIYFEDRTLTIRSVAGIVKSVVDSKMSLDVSERLYWTSDSGVATESLASFLEWTIEDFVEKYGVLKTHGAIATENFEKILKAYAMTALQQAAIDFPKHVKVRTEILSNNISVKATEVTDFLNLKPADLDTQLELLKSREIVALSELDIVKSDFDDVALTLEEEDSEVASDIHKFLLTAAESKATISYVKNLSGGFIWAEILETLQKLIAEEIISLGPVVEESTEDEDDIDYELPLLDDLNEPVDLEEMMKGYLSDDEVEEENETEKSALDLGDNFEYAGFGSDNDLVVTDDEEFTLPSTDIESNQPLVGVVVEMIENDEVAFGSHDDDGSFVYELLNDKTIESHTEGRDDDIEDDVREILREEEVHHEIRDEVFTNLRQNSTLEAELRSIEKTLADGQVYYQDKVEDFEILKFEKNLSSTIDYSEVGRDDEDSLNSIVTQNESNSVFFRVHKLEEDRYLVNLERRELLMKLSTILSEMSSENVQSLISRIERKLDGIDSVSNVAFHNPKDDENEHVDPSLLNDSDITPHTTSDESFVNQLTLTDTPTFFSLVEALGFNPFELKDR